MQTDIHKLIITESISEVILAELVTADSDLDEFELSKQLATSVTDWLWDKDEQQAVLNAIDYGDEIG